MMMMMMMTMMMMIPVKGAATLVRAVKWKRVGDDDYAKYDVGNGDNEDHDDDDDDHDDHDGNEDVDTC